MASNYSKSKGLLSIATSHTGGSGGEYGYTKIDQYITPEGITITPQRAQDLDSYRNANGKLKRHVLKHTASGISFTVRYITESELQVLLGYIRTCFKLYGCEGEPERKVRIRYWDSWIANYSHGYFYIPDTNFQFSGTYKGEPIYLPTTIELIEY